MTQSRLHGLDLLRGVMMILGIVLHGAQMYMATDMAIDYYIDSSRSYSMDALLIIINTFRIPTFFLLSGFFTSMLLTTRGAKTTAKNRWKRIFIPFIVFLPITSFVMGFLKIVSINIQKTGKFGLDINLIENTSRLINNTHNLWFMYYLMMFLILSYLVVTLKRQLFPTLDVSQKLRSIPITNWAVIIIFGLLIGLVGSFSSAGRISAKLSFMPSTKVLLYFGICYLYGWMFYYRKQDIKQLAIQAWKFMAVAWISLVIAFAHFYLVMAYAQSDYYQLFHMGLSLFTGLSVIFFMVGFVGLFSRYFNTENPWIKYIADSSYWIYLFHSVPLVSIALLISSWETWAELKFVIVSGSSFLICLVTYHYWVRDTKIGLLLNGRRYPKIWP